MVNVLCDTVDANHPVIETSEPSEDAESSYVDRLNVGFHKVNIWLGVL